MYSRIQYSNNCFLIKSLWLPYYNKLDWLIVVYDYRYLKNTGNYTWEKNVQSTGQFVEQNFSTGLSHLYPFLPSSRPQSKIFTEAQFISSRLLRNHFIHTTVETRTFHIELTDIYDWPNLICIQRNWKWRNYQGVVYHLYTLWLFLIMLLSLYIGRILLQNM